MVFDVLYLQNPQKNNLLLFFFAKRVAYIRKM